MKSTVSSLVSSLVSSFGLLLFGGLFLAAAGCNTDAHPARGPGAGPNPPAPPTTAPVAPTGDAGNVLFKTLRISPYRVPCLVDSQTACMISLDANGQPLEQIQIVQGFEYQWGHRYTLDVSEDQTGALILNKIDSDVAVPMNSAFRLPISREDITPDPSISCLFHSSAGFTFGTSTAAACSQLRAQLTRNENPGEGWVGQFKFSGRADQPALFTVLRVENVTDWAAIRVVETDLAAEGCRESILEIQRNGTYVRSSCAGAKLSQGMLRAADVAQLQMRIAAVEVAPIGKRSCAVGAADENQHRGVYLATVGGGLYSLEQSSRQATCYRGDQAAAQALSRELTDLKTSYNLASPIASGVRPPGHGHGPVIVPVPEPVPTPSAGLPRPAPVPPGQAPPPWPAPHHSDDSSDSETGQHPVPGHIHRPPVGPRRTA